MTTSQGGVRPLSGRWSVGAGLLTPCGEFPHVRIAPAHLAAFLAVAGPRVTDDRESPRPNATLADPPR